VADLIEYHGWAVLFCHLDDWSDEEWDYARGEVQKAVATLAEEAGHAAHMNWPANGGSVVALNGWDETADAPLRVLRRIAEVAPHSYGELVVFPEASPQAADVKRYRMSEGVLQGPEAVGRASQ
jgi:hypothetical protein